MLWRLGNQELPGMALFRVFWEKQKPHSPECGGGGKGPLQGTVPTVVYRYSSNVPIFPLGNLRASSLKSQQAEMKHEHYLWVVIDKASLNHLMWRIHKEETELKKGEGEEKERWEDNYQRLKTSFVEVYWEITSMMGPFSQATVILEEYDVDSFYSGA